MKKQCKENKRFERYEIFYRQENKPQACVYNVAVVNTKPDKNAKP